MRAIAIETITHGRVLVHDAAVPNAAGLLVAFHGYAESPEDCLGDVQQIPGAGEWCIAAIQGLSRFYTRREERVVSSWMTKQDRELIIGDNIQYVDKAMDALVERPDPNAAPQKVVLLGYSQGVAMAYRAAMRGRHQIAGVIALGGDVPPDLRQTGANAVTRKWPRVLIGAGDKDHWYTAAKVQSDENFFQSRGVTYKVARYDGGHEWSDEFRAAAGHFLDSV